MQARAPDPSREVHATCRSASICRSHPSGRFQLAKIRLNHQSPSRGQQLAAGNADTARRNRTASALDRTGLVGACLRGPSAMC